MYRESLGGGVEPSEEIAARFASTAQAEGVGLPVAQRLLRVVMGKRTPSVSSLGRKTDDPDDALFTITPGGTLSFIAPPDYEHPIDVGGTAGDSIYLIGVRVTDEAGETAEATMTVNVRLVNDNAPLFAASAHQTLTIVEESINGTVVGQAVATDADLPGDTLNYSIADGDPLGGYSIDAYGQMTIVDASVLDLDFDHGTAQVATLTARGRGISLEADRRRKELAGSHPLRPRAQGERVPHSARKLPGRLAPPRTDRAKQRLRSYRPHFSSLGARGNCPVEGGLIAVDA
jgi:hypothetical protein